MDAVGGSGTGRKCSRHIAVVRVVAVVLVVWRCCVALSYLPSCCSIELRNKTNKRSNRKHMHINCPYRIILMKKSLFSLVLSLRKRSLSKDNFQCKSKSIRPSKLNDLNNLKSHRRQTKGSHIADCISSFETLNTY